MIRRLCIFLLALTCQGASVVRIPFVGCKSDGQVGPLPAPSDADKVVQIDASIARKLAYYRAEMGSGVLAPRGWYCFGGYGSGGSALFVTPQPIGDNFPSTWPEIAGPAVQINYSDGGTSGRYTVGRVIARVFPRRKAFVLFIIESGLGLASDFPFGPYPNDKLTYHGDRIVEYQTPPHSEGLGTISRLQANGDPVEGAAILQGPTPDLLLLTVRVPPDKCSLASHIIRQVEREDAESRAKTTPQR